MAKRALRVLVGAACSVILLAAACADDESPTAVPTLGDASPPERRDGATLEDEDGGGEAPDGGAEDCSGKFVAPVLDGDGPCGTIDFGAPAAAFEPVDVDAGTEYSGVALADGIYDAVMAERASGSAGSWRETFVVSGNRFTRVRQIDMGSGPGAITYRAGTFAYDGQTIKLTYDCARTGDAGVDAGSDTLPSDAVVASDCSARYRYGAAGIRVTLRRR